METARIAKGLNDGDSSYQQRARAALPLLVRLLMHELPSFMEDLPKRLACPILEP